MNNHPIVYYQPNSVTIDTEVKCKFCNSLLLPAPVHNMHHSSSFWLCLSCPNPVYYGSSTDDYSLLCRYKNHWYSFVYLPLTKQYLIYQIKTHLTIYTDQGTENYSITRELIKQIDSEQNITPKNVQDKLLTILTFS
jgi:hypothetical protein